MLYLAFLFYTSTEVIKQIMGKGDKRSKKGKIFKGSNGKARPTAANRNAKAKKETAAAGK